MPSGNKPPGSLQKSYDNQVALYRLFLNAALLRAIRQSLSSVECSIGNNLDFQIRQITTNKKADGNYHRRLWININISAGKIVFPNRNLKYTALLKSGKGFRFFGMIFAPYHKSIFTARSLTE